MEIETNVERIIECERRAGERAAEADELRWEAARLISEELDAGKSQRELAKEISRSHTHVRYMANSWDWKRKFPAEDRPFNEVYNDPTVRKKPTEGRRWRTEAEELIGDARKRAKWSADPSKHYHAVAMWLEGGLTYRQRIKEEDLDAITPEGLRSLLPDAERAAEGYQDLADQLKWRLGSYLDVADEPAA